MESDSNNKGLMKSSMNWHILNWFAMIGMFATSIYLTNHYFEVMFPTNLTGKSLCDINSFLSCDSATQSAFSNIFGVPISLIGLIVSVFLMATYIFKSENMEKANYVVLVVNMIGCLVLFSYSLIVLKALCPFCTLYYIFSAIALWVYYKNSPWDGFSFNYMAIYAVVILVIGGATWKNIEGKTNKKSQLAKSLVKQFYGLPRLGKPASDSPFLVAKATEKFTDSIVRITKFSDFECPACLALSEHLEKIADDKKYAGKVSIQYKFYPLDINCNPGMKRQIHANACHASYLAFCAPEKFKTLHHDIFAQTGKGRLTKKWIDQKAKELGIEACVASPETKAAVTKIVSEAKPFNVSSTPTMLINGVKIEGVLPLDQIKIIVDEIIERGN